MNKRDKLKEILRTMNGESIDFSAFDASVAQLRKSLEEKIAIPTIEQVQLELDKFLKKLDLEPVLSSLEGVKSTMDSKISELSNRLEQKIQEQINSQSETETNIRTFEIEGLKSEIDSLKTTQQNNIKLLVAEIKKIYGTTSKLIENLIIPPDREEEITLLEGKLEKFRHDFITRLSNLGGGAMNRQILVNGVNYLTQYTDINLIGSITATTNNTTKRTDITFSSSGGSGLNQLTKTAGNVDGNNTIFSWSGTPIIIITDQQRTMQKVSIDTTVNWTGTSTTTLTIAPNFDLIALG